MNARDCSGCVPATVLSALHVLIHLILLKPPRGRHQYLHFSGQETGTERLGHLPKASQLRGVRIWDSLVPRSVLCVCVWQ